MIELRKVNKFFGQHHVLKDISFKVPEGGITAFLGLNGAGKTTTMRLIDGILSPASGEIKVAGYSPIKNNLEVKRRVGYLAENNPLYQELRVSEYLSFIAQIRGIKGFPRDFLDLFKRMGITQVWNKKIEALSHGYRQRVGLTAALLHSPQVLVLDEPLSGLDPVQKEEIIALLEDISRQTTILFSTHILPEVERLCKKVIIIHRGRVRYDGYLKETANGKVRVSLKYQGPKRLGQDLISSFPKQKIINQKMIGKGKWQMEIELSSKNSTRIIPKISSFVSRQGGVILNLQEETKSLAGLFQEIVKDEKETN